MRQSAFFLYTVVLAAGVFWCAAPLKAQTVVGTHPDRWIGPSGGDWNTAANWDTNLVPMAAYSTAIDSVAYGYFSLAGNGQALELDVSNGSQFTILKGGDLQLSSLNYQSNYLNVNAGGKLELQDRYVLQNLGTNAYINGELNLADYTTIKGSIYLGPNSQAGQITGGSTMYLATGTSIYAYGTSSIQQGFTLEQYNRLDVHGALTIDGTLTNSDASLHVIPGGSLTLNHGLNMDGGEYNLGGNIYGAGSLSVIDSGTTVDLYGGNFLSSPGQDAGSLALTRNDGTLNVGSPYLGNAYTMGSDFTNYGTLSIGGALTTGGAFHNYGDTFVSGTLNLNGAFDGNITVNGGTLNSLVDSKGRTTIDAGQWITLQPGSTLGFADTLKTNNGTLELQAANLTLTQPFQNNGSIIASPYMIHYSWGDVVQSSASTMAASGGFTNNGILTLANNSNLDFTGNLVNAPGGTINAQDGYLAVHGTLTNFGTLNSAGLTTDVLGNVAADGTLSGGTYNLTGQLRYAGPDITRIANGTSVTLTGPSATFNNTAGSWLTSTLAQNDGVFAANGGATLHLQTLTNNGTMSFSDSATQAYVYGTLTNSATGSLTIQNGAQVNAYYVQNDGTALVTGANSVFNTGSGLTNNGSLTVALGGSLSNAYLQNGTGTITVTDPGSTANLSGYNQGSVVVANGGQMTVAYFHNGAGATLTATDVGTSLTLGDGVNSQVVSNLGTMTVQNGATASAVNAWLDNSGTLTVTGAGSTLTTPILTNDPGANLSVLNGGAVAIATSTSFNPGFSNNGNMLIDGPGSKLDLRNANWLSLGTATISNGGVVMIPTDTAPAATLNNVNLNIRSGGQLLDANLNNLFGGAVVLQASSVTFDTPYSVPLAAGYGNGAVLVNGSSLTAPGFDNTGGYIRIDATSSADFRGGAFANLDPTGTLSGGGTYDISGTLRYDASSGLIVNNQATIFLNEGGWLLSGTQNALESLASNSGTLGFAGPQQYLVTSGALDNSGWLRLIDNATLVTGGAVTNSGTVDLETGASLISGGDYSNQGQTYIQDGASLSVDGVYTNQGYTDIDAQSSLSAYQYVQTAPGASTMLCGDIFAPFDMSAGTLAGDAEIHGDLTVSGGEFAPNGIFKIDGDYIQTGGTLVLDISSLTDFSQLLIGGAASLHGTIEIVLLNGFSFAPNTDVAFFQATNGVTFGSDLSFMLPAGVQLYLGANGFDVGAQGGQSSAPEPATFGLAAAALWSIWLRGRPRGSIRVRPAAFTSSRRLRA